MWNSYGDFLQEKHMKNSPNIPIRSPDFLGENNWDINEQFFFPIEKPKICKSALKDPIMPFPQQ